MHCKTLGKFIIIFLHKYNLNYIRVHFSSLKLFEIYKIVVRSWSALKAIGNRHGIWMCISAMPGFLVIHEEHYVCILCVYAILKRKLSCQNM